MLCISYGLWFHSPLLVCKVLNFMMVSFSKSCHLERTPELIEFSNAEELYEHLKLRDKRLFGRAYINYLLRKKKVNLIYDENNYNLFVNLKRYINSFGYDRFKRMGDKMSHTRQVNRQLYELIRETLISRYENGKIILRDGKSFRVDDYQGLFKYLRTHQLTTTVKQNGVGNLANDIVNKYAAQLQAALVAQKLRIVNSVANIAQLSMSVLQLVICIINITVYGTAVGNVISLVVAIGQVLLAVACVIGDTYILNRGGDALEIIASMVREYCGNPTETSKQFSMPSLEIMLSAIVGLVGAGIAGCSMFNLEWAKNFSKNMIHADKFRQSLKSSVKDTRSFVEEVAETCFQVQLSPMSQLFEQVTAINSEISVWLQKTDSFLVANPGEMAKFSGCLARAEKMYTSYRARSGELENRYTNALTLLFRNLTMAGDRLNHLRRLRSNTRTKQEPPAFMFVGRHGVGKTQFINSWLIPNIQKRMGWSENKYSIDFGGQPEFWPVYLGEEVAFYDEFFSLKDKDPVVPHLNRICSNGHNIIPGANTYTKEQECCFKVLLLGANTHYVDFGNVLSVDSARAMYSRLKRFEVINATTPPEDDYDRSRIQHSDTYKELEFRRYLNPATLFSQNSKDLTGPGTDTRSLKDPYDVVTKEQILEEIVQLILVKEKEFLKVNKEDQCVKDSLGCFITNDPVVLENKPVIRNLIEAKREDLAVVGRRQLLFAQMGTDNYTAESLQTYLFAVFEKMIAGSMTSQEIDRFIHHLEAIVVKDVVTLTSLLKVIQPLVQQAGPHLSVEQQVSMMNIFLKYNLHLKISSVARNIDRHVSTKVKPVMVDGKVLDKTKLVKIDEVIEDTQSVLKVPSAVIEEDEEDLPTEEEIVKDTFKAVELGIVKYQKMAEIYQGDGKDNKHYEIEESTRRLIAKLDDLHLLDGSELREMRKKLYPKLFIIFDILDSNVTKIHVAEDPQWKSVKSYYDNNPDLYYETCVMEALDVRPSEARDEYFPCRYATRYRKFKNMCWFLALTLQSKYTNFTDAQLVVHFRARGINIDENTFIGIYPEQLIDLAKEENYNLRLINCVSVNSKMPPPYHWRIPLESRLIEEHEHDPAFQWKTVFYCTAGPVGNHYFPANQLPDAFVDASDEPQMSVLSPQELRIKYDQFFVSFKKVQSSSGDGAQRLMKPLNELLDHLSMIDETKKVEYAQAFADIEIPEELMQNDGFKDFLEKIEVPIQQDMDVVEHLVLYVHGPPGSGKSTLAQSMGMQLASLLRLPVVQVKSQNLSEVVVCQRSIIILHDKVKDEEVYSQWYDTLPTGCIIFNTNNYPAKLHTGMSAVWNRVRRYYTLETVQTIPGYGRRCGLPGYVYHGAWSYTNPALRREISVPSFGKYLYNGKNSTTSEMINDLFTTYSQLMAEDGKIELKKLDKFTTDFVGDLKFVASSLEKLQEAVMSAKMMMTAYAFPNKDLSITISAELANSEFTFNANDFVLPKCHSTQDIIEMALKTYALLRSGGRKFTAHIVTPEVEIRCINSKIHYVVQEKAATIHTWRVTTLDHVVYIEILDTTVTANRVEEVLCGRYEARSIMSAFVNGFHTLHPNTPEFDHMQYLLEQREQIEQHPELLPFKVVATPITVNMAAMTQEYSMFAALWTSFTKSKMFKVLLVIGVILMTIATLLILWNVGSYLVKLFGGKPEERKCPTFIVAHGLKYGISPKTSGSSVHFEVTPPEGEDIDPEVISPVLETIVSSVYGDSYNLGNISGVVKQFNSLNVHDKKAKAPKVQAVRVINSTKQNMLDNEGHMAVRKHILSNQCVVSYGNAKMYGLRWKGHEVILPAHLITNESRVINVWLPLTMANNTYGIVMTNAYVYHLDYANDIAIARISDKTIPAAKDITKYFHKETQMHRISNVALMKRAAKCDEINYYVEEVHVFLGQGSIVRHCGKSTQDTPNTALEFYLAQYQKIPTVAGDCGSPYVSMDATCNTAMLIGLHTNRDISGRKTWSNVISQEYLTTVASRPNNVEKQGMFNYIPIDFGKIQHPEFEPLSEQWMFEDVYEDACNSLEQEVESDIFYDAEENPGSNLLFLGKEKKFKPTWIGKPSHQPTPWQQELESVVRDIGAPDVFKTGYLSLTDVKQHPDPSVLKILNGKPSIVATQIDMYSDPIPWSTKQQKLVEKVRPIYRAMLDKQYGRKFRVLTDLETINGLYFENDPFYGHFDAMDLDTSAGDYPKRFYNITTKRPLFEKVPYDLDRDVYYWKDTTEAQAVRASVAFMEEQAKQNIRVVYPATDSLKYELQSKPNKSRVFQALSLQEIMLIRKYSGSIQSMISQRCLEATCAVGIDPVVGFHYLAMRYKKVSGFGINGDYTRWDKHVLRQLIKEVIDDLYERLVSTITDEEEKKLIRGVFNVIYDLIVYTLCVADGNWYLKMRGNPSGNVLTSILNSLVNYFMTLMSVVDMVEEHNAFLDTKPTDLQLLKRYGEQFRSKLPLMRKKITDITKFILQNTDWSYYGDDEIGIISPDYLWLINFYTTRKFYQDNMGISYDSPNKDGVFTIFDKIENLSFLSRTFRDHCGTTLPALKSETVNAFLYWSRANTTEQWAALLDSAICEAVLHPKEYYQQVRTVVLWIIEWCRTHNMEIPYVPPMYETKLQETLQIIHHGRSPGSTLTPVDQRIEISFEHLAKPVRIVKAVQIVNIKNKTEQLFSKQLLSCVHCNCTMGNRQMSSATLSDGEVFDDLIEIHQKLEKVFQHWEGEFLTGYHPMPALIQSAQGNVISVGFKANEYVLSRLHNVQSDLAKYVEAQTGLRMKLITICYRILNPKNGYAEPIWQVHFTNVATTAVHRLMATQIVLDKKNYNNFQTASASKMSTTQATGTAEMNMISEHYDDTKADAVMPADQGTARGVLTRAPIWHLNLADTVVQYREMSDSPRLINMEAAVHSVVDKLSYGDMSKMPTCMRWWAYSHESGAPTIWLKLVLVSAATIVNQFIIGMADSNKSTYTVEELQQIEGVVINPQEGSICIPIRLAATSLTNEAPTRVTFTQTPIDGTDANPVLVPTLVILTATEIQNAYDNAKVKVNIRKLARFGDLKEPWFITSRSLLSMKSALTPAPGSRIGTQGFQRLSTVLGLPVGYPMFITCDGAYIQDHKRLPSRVSVSKNLPLLDKNMQPGVVRQTCDMTGDIRYYAHTDGGGSVWSAEFLSQDQLDSAKPRFEIDMYGKTASDQMNGLLGGRVDNKPIPCLPFKSSVMLLGQGDSCMPPSVSLVNTVISEDLSPDSVYLRVIEPWLENLTPEYAYVVSEIPTTIKVDVYYRLVNSTVTRAVNVPGDTVEGSLIGSAIFNCQSGNTTPEDPQTDKRTFIVTHIIETTHPSQGSSTIYAAYCNDKFTNDAFARISQRPVSATVVNIAGINFDSFNFVYNRFVANQQVAGSMMLETAFIPNRGTLEPVNLASTPARIVLAKSNPVSTLGTGLSRLVLANTLPKTVPQTVAMGRGNVEVRDDYCYQQLRLYIEALGISVPQDQVLMFQIYMQSGLTVVATVVYDYQTNELYVVNKPASDNDYYRTLRKLLAEDVFVGNFNVVEKSTGVVPYTDTSAWVDRVVSDKSQGVYTGTLLSRLKIRTKQKTSTTQSEVLLPLLAGGGQAMTAIMQYLMWKQKLDQDQKNKLEQMEKEFQYKMQMQQQQQGWKEKMAGIQNPVAQMPLGTGVSDASQNDQKPTLYPGLGSQQDDPLAKFRKMLFQSGGLLVNDPGKVEPGDGNAAAPTPDSNPPAETPNTTTVTADVHPPPITYDQQRLLRGLQVSQGRESYGDDHFPYENDNNEFYGDLSKYQGSIHPMLRKVIS